MISEIKLPTKIAELRVRRYIRQYVGAHKNCKINIVQDEPYKLPKLTGSKGMFVITKAGFTTFRGKKNIYSGISYIRSTLKIDIGINILNSIKSHFLKKTSNE